MTAALTSSARVVPEHGDGGVFLSAAHWIEAVLLGPVATSIAVIAVASIGLLMLSGRVGMRRGATVIVGCFILFGAASIAHGLRGAASTVAGPTASLPVPASSEPPVALLPPPPEPAPATDPYAGASIRR